MFTLHLCLFCFVVQKVVFIGWSLQFARGSKFDGDYFENRLNYSYNCL